LAGKDACGLKRCQVMNAHDQTECRAVKDLLVALSAGELESELASQLRAHLDVCADCSETLAEFNRAQQLAVELKLASPKLDRYPEFLRRLAASEAQAEKEAELMIAESVESNDQIVALAAIQAEKDLASAASQAGAAAVIPLFGNRLVFRSGFGRGFDLQIISKQQRELFRLSANSLAKAAAIVAGVGVFAATTLFALGAVIVLLVQQWQKPGQQIRQDGPLKEQRPQPFQAIPPNLPWLQTVTGDNRTLAIWKAGRQVQAGFINSQDAKIPGSFTLLIPMQPEDRPSFEPGITDCALATDGQNFVVVREHSSNILAWSLKPPNDKHHPPLSERPIVLSNKGVQPAIAWAGGRYLVVWIEPDPYLPKIKMIELGGDGRPLQASAIIVAETERENEKLGAPIIAAHGGKAMVVYQKQGGALIARMWDQANGLSGLPVELLQQKGFMINRPLLTAVGDGFYFCLGENHHEGAELRLVKINLAGEVQKVQMLAVLRMPILTFDFRVTGEGMALIWSEAAVGGAQIFAQRFSLEGAPSTAVVNLTPSEIPPLAFAFADADGKAMIWHEAHPVEMQLPIAIRRIDWNR